MDLPGVSGRPVLSGRPVVSGCPADSGRPLPAFVGAAPRPPPPRCASAVTSIATSISTVAPTALTVVENRDPMTPSFLYPRRARVTSGHLTSTDKRDAGLLRRCHFRTRAGNRGRSRDVSLATRVLRSRHDLAAEPRGCA